MTPEISSGAEAVAEAERIIREDATKGFAWSPIGFDVRRYGIVNGFIKPALAGAHLPPIVYNAPEAGREDWRAIKAHRRTRAS